MSWVSERMTHFQLLKKIKLKPHPHSPSPVVSPPLTRPLLRLLPGQIRSSVTSSCLVPDISFIFWLSLIFIKTYNCYILSSIPKFCSKTFFFFKFSGLIPLCTDFSCVQIVLIQTSEGVFLDVLDTPFSLPPSLLLWAHFKGRGYEMVERYSSFYP